jgi:hypothetical protein
MRTIARTRWTNGRFHVVAALLSLTLVLMFASSRLGAQEEPPLPPITPTGLTRTLAAIASTPLGALTPVGPVMATSRDDPLLVGVRLQYGSRALPEGRSLTSYALTANFQIEGGALISATVGQQRGDAEICAELSCDPDRWMAGLRYSTSLVTTRPFLEVPFFNKNDATGTAALEFGGGWANKGFGERPHWTADITMPLSLAVGQYIRVVTFATPTLAVAWGTTERRWSRGQRFLIGGGVTAQEIGQLIGLTGLDVSVGLQRAFSPFGTTFGASVSWMRIP